MTGEKAVDVKKLNLVIEWWYDSSTQAYIYQCPECEWENRHQHYHCEGCGIKLDGVKE